MQPKKSFHDANTSLYIIMRTFVRACVSHNCSFDQYRQRPCRNNSQQWTVDFPFEMRFGTLAFCHPTVVVIPSVDSITYNTLRRFVPSTSRCTCKSHLYRLIPRYSRRPRSIFLLALFLHKIMYPDQSIIG